MLGVSGLMGSSGDGAAAESGGGASGGSSDVGGSSSIPMDDISEKSGSAASGGGNRWPRQETLALLKIRSDMDVAFKDSSLKGPLWEEVSRKMAELGFQRNPKKCKEKFENVYKYHKRTKDGRSSKPEGKSYRFFDQLAALENAPPLAFLPPPPRPQPQLPLPPAAPIAVAPPPLNPNNNLPMPSHITTVSSSSPNPLSVAPPNTATNPFQQPIQQILNTSNPPQTYTFQPSQPNLLMSFLSNSTSSSTSSDEDIQMRRGKKRKWKEFFEKLMMDVVHKQEDMQKKFLDTLEKRERDRMAREEAWRVQEMARLKQEHELLVQERSVAATKDNAVIAFLQKVTDQHNLHIPTNKNVGATPPPASPPQVTMQVQSPVENHQQLLPHKQSQSQSPPPPPPQFTYPSTTIVSAMDSAPVPLSTPTPTPQSMAVVTINKPVLEVSKFDNGGDLNQPSSSRWPKAEVEALIKLRTNLELKYQDNGPKGPLWEEISSAMAKIGYNRSSKRCKEKWENINKYYKKVKESNKRRPEDSKTCPYFHQLDTIYKEKAKNPVGSYSNPMAPIMVQPEQQWPIQVQQQQQQEGKDSVMQDQDSDNYNDINDEDEDGDDDEEEDEGGGYEMVSNKQQPSSVE